MQCIIIGCGRVGAGLAQSLSQRGHAVTVQVAAISRGGSTFLPTLGTVFQAGDVLHLVVLATSAERLKALFG